MPARNESWCLALTLRAALLWSDHLVVLDHASTDDTAKIIYDAEHEYPGRITALHEPDGVWEEMRHRQRMLLAARALKATHIALVDADELLAGPIGVMHDFIETFGKRTLLQVPWICLDTPEHYYSSGIWSEQSVSLAFKDDPSCFWASRNGYDFHHRQPMGPQWRIFGCNRNRYSENFGGLLHLQFLNKRRLKAKQYLYQLTERLRWPDREPTEMVRDRYAATVNAALSAETREVPGRWWQPYTHLMQYLRIDSGTTWQEQECKRIVARYPGIEAGLDDFGLAL